MAVSEHPFQNFMVRFAPGDRVFVEGEPGKSMFIVQSGKIRLYREIAGEEQSIGLLDKGDFFGEMSILEGMPRTIGAVAIEPSELIEITTTIFDKMIRGNIEIAIRMLRKLSLRLRDTERRVAELQASGARVAKPVAATPETRKPSTTIETGVRLEVSAGGPTFCVGDDEVLIGRYDPVTEQRPDIDLTDHDLKRSVSRRHARILRTDQGHVVIEEVGALNGTFVNDVRLVPGQGHPIADGDELNIGTVSMVFHT